MLRKTRKEKSNPKDLITKQLKKDLGKSFEVQQLTEEKVTKVVTYFTASI